jgi:hypothetical protein
MVFGGMVLFVILLVIILSNNMTLKLIYVFLIGIFLAIFVGVGIAAFYPEPKYPEAPKTVRYGCTDVTKEGNVSVESKSQIDKFEQEEKDYREQSKIYSKNVSILALISSIIIVIASLTLFKKIFLIADGLLLGGVLTLLYSVIRGFGAEDNIFRFIVVSVGLFVSLFLGYVKFVKQNSLSH